MIYKKTSPNRQVITEVVKMSLILRTLRTEFLSGEYSYNHGILKCNIRPMAMSRMTSSMALLNNKPNNVAQRSSQRTLFFRMVPKYRELKTCSAPNFYGQRFLQLHSADTRIDWNRVRRSCSVYHIISRYFAVKGETALYFLPA